MNNNEIKVGDLVKIVPDINCQCWECLQTNQTQHNAYGFISPFGIVYKIYKDFFSKNTFPQPKGCYDCFVLFGIFERSNFGHFGRQFLTKI